MGIQSEDKVNSTTNDRYKTGSGFLSKLIPGVSKKYKTWLLIIFLISILLNLGMVIINRESNDNHVKVVTMIMQDGKLPSKDDCSECFSPKFYHWFTAKVIQLAGISPLNHNFHVNFGAELINFSAATVMLLVIALFITGLPEKSETLKLLSFGMVAFNPKLIGIDSQATNDTFAIVLSTLALYFAYLYFRQPKRIYFLLVLIFLSLGVASKTNVLVSSIAIALAFIVRAWTSHKGRGLAWLTVGIFLFSCTFLIVINPLSQFISNYRLYGNPMVVTTSEPDLPKFIEPTISGRPGVLSFTDALLTFKFFDLLKHPIISNGADYFANRTSLWTQIYGRANSVHFDNWPYTWQPIDTKGFPLSRTIYVFALIPTMLLLFGAALEFKSIAKSIIKRDPLASARSFHGLLTITFIGYLSFVALYALLYRDFSFMKAIFIYPAILSFPYFFICGIRFILNRLNKPLLWLKSISILWMIVLFSLYIADILTMIQLIYSKSNLSNIF